VPLGRGAGLVSSRVPNSLEGAHLAQALEVHHEGHEGERALGRLPAHFRFFFVRFVPSGRADRRKRRGSRARQPFRLEAARLARRGSRADDRLVADHPAHCRIAAQPGRHRSRPHSRRAAQGMPAVLARARVSKHLDARFAQARGVIQFAIGEQSEVITLPQSWSIRRRSKSSLRAPLWRHSSGLP
jgi:hypothetical protein